METERLDSQKEVTMWRNLFLNEVMNDFFTNLSEKNKNTLENFFLSISSSSFTTPWQEWNKCVCALIRTLEK